MKTLKLVCTFVLKWIESQENKSISKVFEKYCDEDDTGRYKISIAKNVNLYWHLDEVKVIAGQCTTLKRFKIHSGKELKKIIKESKADEYYKRFTNFKRN